MRYRNFSRITGVLMSYSTAKYAKAPLETIGIFPMQSPMPTINPQETTPTSVPTVLQSVRSLTNLWQISLCCTRNRPSPIKTPANAGINICSTSLFTFRCFTFNKAAAFMSRGRKLLKISCLQKKLKDNPLQKPPKICSWQFSVENIVA